MMIIIYIPKEVMQNAVAYHLLIDAQLSPEQQLPPSQLSSVL